MKKALRSTLICIAFSILFGSQFTVAAPLPSEIKTIVAFVFIPGKEPGKFKPYGTAFFVGIKDSKNSERSFVYLVTAKHVLQELDPRACRGHVSAGYLHQLGFAKNHFVELIPEFFYLVKQPERSGSSIFVEAGQKKRLGALGH